MKINRSELIQTLTIARMAVAGSDHLEQLGHFIFGGENLITFNNRILIYYPYKTDFQCSIRSELFYKQLEKFDSEFVDIELTGNRLEIKGTSEVAKIVVKLKQDTEIFEVIDTIRKEQLEAEYSAVPEDFITAIDFCSYSASKNAADGTLCCICINQDKVIACDNYRVTKYKLKHAMTEGDTLIDARIASEIKHFKMTEFSIGENWLHFRNDKGVIFSARQIFGDYPDLVPAFHVKGVRIELPKNTSDILDFVSVITAEDQQLERKADIEIKDGRITAQVVKDSASAEKSITLHADYESLEMRFRVHIEFLKSVLKHTPMMVYSEELKKVKFRTQSFQHVIRLSPDPNQSKIINQQSSDSGKIPF